MNADGPVYYDFDIAQQTAAKALKQIGLQTGAITLFSYDLAEATEANAVVGRYTLLEALNALLKDTGLSGGLSQKRVISITNIGSAERTNEEKPMLIKKKGLLAFLAVVFAVPAATGQQPADSASLLEEIIVTAQKREENLDKIPLHIQAFTANSLREAQITRVEEIINLSPTVNFSTRRGFDQTSVRIRGVGTAELGSGVEPSVATVVDGVVMARGGSTFNELPDIERIEVLNGPQGTLFGKNASVGLINIITKKPNTEEADGSFSVRGTSDEDYGARFSYSAPLDDKLAFRTSGFMRNYDGNVFNVVTDNKVNGVDAFGSRTKLSWQVSDTFDALFSADYSRQITTCCARVHREERISPADAAGRPGTPDIDSSFVNHMGGNLSGGLLAGTAAEVLGPQIRIGDENERIAQNFDPFQESINRGVSAELNWELAGGHLITSLTAYREWEATSGWDNDFTAFAFQRRQQHDRDVEWFSQEFRLTSPESDTLDYILGLYYYTATTDALELSDRTTIDTGQTQLFIIDAESGYDNIAAFGHANYHVSDSINLFGGFRVLNDEAKAKARWRRCEGFDAQPGLGGDFDCSTPFANGKENDTEVTYKVGAQYFSSDNFNLFTSFSTGYKGRGYSLEFGLNTGRIQNGEEPIPGEETESFEIGFRGTIADRVKYSVIYYDTTIDGFQQSLRDLATISNRLGSVEELTTEGFEASITAYLTDSISFSGSYGYNKAIYSDFKNANCYLGQTAAQGCVSDGTGGTIQDRSGEPLEAAPENRLILSGRYESQRLGLRPFAQFNYRWMDDSNVSSNGDPSTIQESFGILDLSAGFITADERITVTAFVKNAGDEFYIQGADVNGSDMGGVVLHYLPRDYERLFGLSVDYQF